MEIKECPHCTPDGSFPNQDGRICPFCSGKHDLDEIEYEIMKRRFNEWIESVRHKK